MATVTGLTAARMLAIEGASVVSGVIDDTGHLILSQFDGTQIDAGSMAGKGVQYVTGIAESDLPTAYPDGISIMVLQSGSGWTLNNGIGSVVTYKFNDDRYQQTYFANAGGTASVLEWERAYNTTVGGGGWTPWMPMNVLNIIPDPENFDQSDAISFYPMGESYAFFTSADTSGWDFPNSSGELRTYRDDANSYARQTWYRNGGSLGGNHTEVWTRTLSPAGAWNNWIKQNDTGWINLTLASGFTTLPNGETIQYRIKNDVVFVAGGAAATFNGTGVMNAVATGGLPSIYRPSKSIHGGAEGSGARVGSFEVSTDGSVKLGANTSNGTLPAWLAFSTSYPLN